MTVPSLINRRGVLLGQAALLAAAVPVSASAQSALRSLTVDDTDRLDDSRLWMRGTADDFTRFVNQPFTAYAHDGSIHHLRLTDVEASTSGPARPKDLMRSEGVTLTFHNDFAEDFAPDGHRMVTLRHPALGDMDVMLSSHPRRSGKTDIELVLN